jgi:hypothetical protein
LTEATRFVRLSGVSALRRLRVFCAAEKFTESAKAEKKSEVRLATTTRTHKINREHKKTRKTVPYFSFNKLNFYKLIQQTNDVVEKSQEHYFSFLCADFE